MRAADRALVPAGGGGRILAVLGVEDIWRRRALSIRSFGVLPKDVREQASWGRILSDPEWGWPLPESGIPRKIPFTDITG